MRTMLIVFAVATLGLSAFAAWLFFGGPEDDPTRVKHAQYMTRIEKVRPKAEAGDIAGQFALGSLLHHGEHGAKDAAEAFKWYAKAAERGHVGAQVALGTLHAEGEGVRQDYFRAAEWFRVAATLGNSADAQLALCRRVAGVVVVWVARHGAALFWLRGGWDPAGATCARICLKARR